jgi:hypothetical protein
VDRLQQVTGDIQAARDVFSGHANTLVNDMIALGNALIDFANNGYDPSYLSSDIDNVNIEIQQVRGDVAGLTSHDSDYADASKTFGNDADSFTQSVRRLQRQLKGLPKQ